MLKADAVCDGSHDWLLPYPTTASMVPLGPEYAPLLDVVFEFDPAVDAGPVHAARVAPMVAAAAAAPVHRSRVRRLNSLDPAGPKGFDICLLLARR
jgi:hypothetical protein